MNETKIMIWNVMNGSEELYTYVGRYQLPIIMCRYKHFTMISERIQQLWCTWARWICTIINCVWKWLSIEYLSYQINTQHITNSQHNVLWTCIRWYALHIKHMKSVNKRNILAQAGACKTVLKFTHFECLFQLHNFETYI